MSSPKKPTRRQKPVPRSGLLGVGLDNEDGHKRITQDEFDPYRRCQMKNEFGLANKAVKVLTLADLGLDDSKS